MYRGSKKHLDYMNGWNKEHLVAFTVRFNKEADADIITKLKEVNNRTEYLRQLIQADLHNNRP